MILSLVLLIVFAPGAADFPSEVVAEEFASICLSQPAGFSGAETAARGRGWTEDMPRNPIPMRAGTLAAPTLPWRRVSYGSDVRFHGQQACIMELEIRSCADIVAVAAAVERRIGRPPDELFAGSCSSVWRSAERVIEVGHNGHALVRLFAMDQVRTEAAQ